MRRLGAHLDKEEVALIFQKADMYSTNELSFKEFLICLAIGYVLNVSTVGEKILCVALRTCTLIHADS